MKFEAGKTYALRIGATAEVEAVDGDPRWPITARHDDGARCWHTSEGRFDEHGESSWDLMLPALEGGPPMSTLDDSCRKCGQHPDRETNPVRKLWWTTRGDIWAYRCRCGANNHLASRPGWAASDERVSATKSTP